MPATAIQSHRLSGVAVSASRRLNNGTGLVTPRPVRRARRDSVGGQQEEQVLDVFRRPYRGGDEEYETVDEVESGPIKTLPVNSCKGHAYTTHHMALETHTRKSHRPRLHNRTSSSATILHRPLPVCAPSNTPSKLAIYSSNSSVAPRRNGRRTPPPDVTKATKRNSSNAAITFSSQPRPMKLPRREAQRVPDLTFFSRTLDDPNILSSSFTTHFGKPDEADRGLNRMVLERMTALEQGIQGVIGILGREKRSGKRGWTTDMGNKEARR